MTTQIWVNLEIEQGEKRHARLNHEGEQHRNMAQPWQASDYTNMAQPRRRAKEKHGSTMKASNTRRWLNHEGEQCRNMVQP